MARVVVGHERDPHVADPRLPGEGRLGRLGHVHHVPALPAVPVGLRPGAEPGALHHHDGAALHHRAPLPAGHVGERGGELGVVGVGERQVERHGAVEERALPAGRAVDELVDEHEVPRLELGSQRTAGEGRHQGLHAERCHRPDVRPVVHPVRRDPVVGPVAGEEGHRAAPDHPQQGRLRRRPVGRLQVEGREVVGELVEAGPAEHADVRRTVETGEVEHRASVTPAPPALVRSRAAEYVLRPCSGLSPVHRSSSAAT